MDRDISYQQNYTSTGATATSSRQPSTDNNADTNFLKVMSEFKYNFNSPLPTTTQFPTPYSSNHSATLYPANFCLHPGAIQRIFVGLSVHQFQFLSQNSAKTPLRFVTDSNGAQQSTTENQVNNRMFLAMSI
ncbi:ANM_collapsed_G0054130.mRNA.1.CDS.1 [Saccharomyces cerevisiae]|nr:ANM_collapsed_G0054130.mRNA.1.CDS.1 [Saccharomyces cerevisiae]